MRASERYLVLEFSFNFNQEWGGNACEERSHTSFLEQHPGPDLTYARPWANPLVRTPHPLL